MCIFSGRVAHVSNTNLFARLSGSRQTLVYEMSFSADQEVAMVLPLPVQTQGGLRFISLEDYPDFFTQVRDAFPQPVSRGKPSMGGVSPRGALPVFNVGAFVASFVPSMADFDRLDPRFSLPKVVMQQVKAYGQYGFAVFQLSAGSAQRVHPMALEFETAQPDRVFFPTLHVHDESLPNFEEFDHSLYAQVPWKAGGLWTRSAAYLGRFVNSQRAQGLIDPEGWCYQIGLHGRLPNRDHWLQPG